MNDKNIRKGICKNYGECGKAGAREIIEIRNGDPFECPECHEPLTEVDDNGKPIGGAVKGRGGKKPPKNNLVIYIVAAVVILLLGLVVWYICKPATPIGKSEPVDTPVVVDPEPVDTPVTVDPEPVDTPVAVNPEPVAAGTSIPTPKPAAVHKLSYGTWKGAWKNGKPHGEGTLTYSAETVIDSRDSKGRVAQPGEYVIGTWDEGHLVNGRWFKNDGNKETIIIGKAG